VQTGYEDKQVEDPERAEWRRQLADVRTGISRLEPAVANAREIDGRARAAVNQHGFSLAMEKRKRGIVFGERFESANSIALERAEREATTCGRGLSELEQRLKLLRGAERQLVARLGSEG